MRFDRRKLREVVGALCVLALIFLNFGHAAVAAPGPLGATIAVAADFCGDPVGGDGSALHPPCHACRQGAIALVPAPGPIVPVVFATVAAMYAEPPVVPRALALGSASPRGPPPFV